jgi:uncharacterized protein
LETLDVLVWIAAGIVVVAAAAAVAAAWVWAGRMVHPRTDDSRWQLADYPHLHVELVSFATSTGVRLIGRFFRGATQSTIILTHGYGGSQDEMLPVAETLVRAGFTVLTYNSRSNADTGGKATLGKLETEDLVSAVDYVLTRDDVDPERIGALGFSAGGAMTVMAAARDPRIRALVTDSGWSDVRHWLYPGARRAFRGFWPVARLGLWFLELRAGTRLSDLRPVAVIGQISPRPVLIIHGQSDVVVPPEDAMQDFAAAGVGRQLWLLPDAAHGETVSLDANTYGARVGTFFGHALS